MSDFPNQPPLEAIDELDIHEECRNKCRLSILSQHIDQHPDALAQIDEHGYMPLHWVLWNETSPIDVALLMIDAYPAALKHQAKYGELPIHLECYHQCRSTIVAKCVESYPEGLAREADGFLPLHVQLTNKSSSLDDALMMIKKYPAALKHQTKANELPIHIECKCKCRVEVLRLCIDYHPESMRSPPRYDRWPLALIISRLFSATAGAPAHEQWRAISLLHSANPSYLPQILLHPPFNTTIYRSDPYNQPRHILLNFVRNIEAHPFLHKDKIDLNWRYRSPMLLLLVSIHIQGLSNSSYRQHIRSISESLDKSVAYADKLLAKLIMESSLLCETTAVHAYGVLGQGDKGDSILRHILSFL